MPHANLDHRMKPGDITELQEMVRDSEKLVFQGGGTKVALAAIPEGFACLDLTAWTGITDYQPDEYTITVRSGTPVAAVTDALKENGQYLPFDPVLVEAGATIGGSVASGLNGPGRYRYGGVRDFLLGVKTKGLPRSKAFRLGPGGRAPQPQNIPRSNPRRPKYSNSRQ